MLISLGSLYLVVTRCMWGSTPIKKPLPAVTPTRTQPLFQHWGLDIGSPLAYHHDATAQPSVVLISDADDVPTLGRE